MYNVLPKPRGRLIAVSDVHGNLPLLEKLLQKLELTGDDLLVFAGDMTDKGPQSLATLRLVMALCESGRAAALRGNCEITSGELAAAPWLYDFMEQRRRAWQRRSLLWDMVRAMGRDVRSREALEALRQPMLAAFRREFDFVDALPAVLTCGAFRFAHAGLNSDDPREWDAERCVKWDRFMDEELRFSRTVVVGHWPTTLYSPERLYYGPVFDRARRVISIDGANVLHHWGQLNALIIGDAEDPDSVTWVYEDGHPPVTALEDQAPSERSRAVYYNEPMERLEDRGALTLCRRRSDGYALLVPTEELWERDGSVYASGVSDHRLAVRAGERFSLLWSDGAHHMLKKDGLAGWYDGKLAPVT